MLLVDHVLSPPGQQNDKALTMLAHTELTFLQVEEACSFSFIFRDSKFILAKLCNPWVPSTLIHPSPC
jgi:hypothetical protein